LSRIKRGTQQAPSAGCSGSLKKRKHREHRRLACASEGEQDTYRKEIFNRSNQWAVHHTFF
jgi:hypothetical protein